MGKLVDSLLHFSNPCRARDPASMPDKYFPTWDPDSAVFDGFCFISEDIYLIDTGDRAIRGTRKRNGF